VRARSAFFIEGLDEIDAHVVLAEDGPLVARLQSSGATVEVMPLRERTRDLRKDRVRPSALPLAAVLDTALYVLRLVRRIRAIRPDVVHANTLKAGIYGSLAARIARVPVVWHVRDRIAPDYLRRSTVALLRALIATLPDSVVVNSESTGRTLWRARGGAHAIHSPIPDPVRWLPVDRRTASDRFVVGMIGRIAPWKGQHVFLDAFARAFADGDETAILVGAAMFGGAEAEYETALREQARTLGIADRVTFRGFRSDVWRELVEMHVLVHASVVPEPFGQVVVEAMLAGTPVIATIGGGPSEIVTPEVDGLLVPPGNVGALADALCRLCADAGLRARLARNARVRAQDFSPARSGAAFKAVYTRLLRSREI
jgi:glycosyltransferase involved in cell wall biosynthesis